MQSETQTAPIIITTKPWAGYIVSGLPILFLLFDALGKFVKPDPERWSLDTAKV